MPAKAGIQFFGPWVPAFAGTSGWSGFPAHQQRLERSGARELALVFQRCDDRFGFIERKRTRVEQQVPARPHATEQDARDAQIIEASVFRTRGVRTDVFAGMKQSSDIEFRQK